MAVLAFSPFFFPIFFYLIEKNALLSVLSSERRRRRKRERTFSYFPQRAFRTRILLDVAPSSVNGQVGQPKFAQISARFVSRHDISSSSSSSPKKLRHSSIRGEKLRLNFSPFTRLSSTSVTSESVHARVYSEQSRPSHSRSAGKTRFRDYLFPLSPVF